MTNTLVYLSQRPSVFLIFARESLMVYHHRAGACFMKYVWISRHEWSNCGVESSFISQKTTRNATRFTWNVASGLKHETVQRFIKFYEMGTHDLLCSWNRCWVFRMIPSVRSCAIAPLHPREGAPGNPERKRNRVIDGPLSSELGTHKTVKARLWRPSDKTPSNLSSGSRFARKR